MPKFSKLSKQRLEELKKLEQKRLQQEQANREKITTAYLKFWDEPFPEGSQEIYVIGGNTDSSDSKSSLNTSTLINPDMRKVFKQKKIPKQFSSFKHLFEVMLKFKNDFDEFFEYVDYSYTDYDENVQEERFFYDSIQNAKTARGLFDVVVERMLTYMDPKVFTREKDSTLIFLKDMREF